MDKLLKTASNLFLGSKKKNQKVTAKETEKEEPKKDVKESNLSSENQPAVDYVQSAMKSEVGSKLKNMGKLFVGGLNHATTSKELQAYFSVFGKVIDCVVMRYTSGKSRGFGFVTFANAEDAVKVLDNPDHVLDGREIECRPFDSKGYSKVKKKKESRVFLGGLPFNVTKEDLKQFFSRYGEVKDVIIPHNKQTKQAKGYGFVVFKEEDAAEKCIADRFVYLNERRVFINKADPRDNGLSAQAPKCDDSISIDSELSRQKYSELFPDEDTQSSASGQREIELEQDPELKELFLNFFLDKLAYYDKMNDEKVENEKGQPFNNDTEELEKTLADLLINSDSEDTDSVTDEGSSDDDYENHVACFLPQRDFEESNSRFLGDSISKTLPPKREEAVSKFSALDSTAENIQKASLQFSIRNSSTGSLMCSLCQWTPSDLSPESFLAHCKTSAHRTKLKERFSKSLPQESEPDSKVVFKNEKPKDVESKLMSYLEVTEIQQEYSEKQNKTQSAQKCGTKQQLPYLEQQQQILQRLKRLQQQQQVSIEQLKEKKRKTKRKKQPKPQQEQKQRDVLQEAKKDGVVKPKKENSQDVQQSSQLTEKLKISNVNLKVYALAKGMTCIQPVSENELSCKMCSKIIPKASDFDILMKNVSQHLQSKKHLNKLLETEESLKNVSLKNVEKVETPNSEKKSNEKNAKGKKKPEKGKLPSQKSPFESRDSLLEEPSNSPQKNFSIKKDHKPQIKHNNFTDPKNSEKVKFLCLPCNFCNGKAEVFTNHLQSELHKKSSAKNGPKGDLTTTECNFCHRLLFGSLYEVNLHYSKCLSKKS